LRLSVSCFFFFSSGNTYLKLFRRELHPGWALHLALSAETTSASMEGEEYEEDLLAGDPDDVPTGDKEPQRSRDRASPYYRELYRLCIGAPPPP
jgi:hypothetical protein